MVTHTQKDTSITDSERYLFCVLYDRYSFPWLNYNLNCCLFSPYFSYQNIRFISTCQIYKTWIRIHEFLFLIYMHRLCKTFSQCKLQIYSCNINKYPKSYKTGADIPNCKHNQDFYIGLKDSLFQSCILLTIASICRSTV